MMRMKRRCRYDDGFKAGYAAGVHCAETRRDDIAPESTNSEYILGWVKGHSEGLINAKAAMVFRGSTAGIAARA